MYLPNRSVFWVNLFKKEKNYAMIKNVHEQELSGNCLKNKRRISLHDSPFVKICRNFSTKIQPSIAIIFLFYAYNRSYFFDLYIGLS